MYTQKKNIFKSRLDVNSKHINAKFEGYKLQPFSEAGSLIRTKLPFGELDVKREGQRHNTRLGFRELQARVRFNHLAYGPSLNDHTGVSYFIDADYCLTAVIFDKNTRTTRFDSIVNLIQPIAGVPNYTQPDNSVPIYPEYPSIKSLSHDLIVVSNGIGDIELIGIEEKEGKLLGVSLSQVKYEGDGTEGIQPVPCVLLAARKIKSKVIMVVYSQTSAKKTTFNIATLEMNIPTTMDNITELKTLHIQQGSEVPTYCAITDDGECCILGSETQYQTLKRPSDKKNDESDTVMENVEVNNNTNEATATAITPYQWVQDQSEIVIQFELPEGTPKSAISCQFTKDHLMLIVRAQECEISFPYRKWWTQIKPDESTWTIESSSGLLSLYIIKQDERTRWPQLFEMDDGIMETIDKAKLAEIAQQLEKFTSDPSSNHGPFMQQHPAATDMDEDVDELGQPIIFEIFNRKGDCIQEINSGGKQWLGNAFDISYFNHHRRNNNELLLPSVTCKMDVDGFVYAWSRNENNHLLLKHVATFDAFAFIQASKRDARFIRHDPFNQFITIVESSRNAYLYYQQGEKGNTLIKKQTLVDITQGHDVDVLGVQMILENTLFILTESEILTIFV
ncbi:hypothetical protein BJ944DRAFT_157149 [Cunninghamella echinulata]|nr:hypothetical protein BJ944DRAFT_157149 [Cunninghamella echinulata]